MKQFEFKVTVELGDTLDKYINDDEKDFYHMELKDEIKDNIYYYLTSGVLKGDCQAHIDDINISIE